jgi:hypothetical protein
MPHPLLTALETELRQLATSVRNVTGDDRAASVMQGNGLAPSVDRHELAHTAIALADQIKIQGSDAIRGDEQKLNEYKTRLEYMRTNTVPNLFNGHAPTTVPAYLITLDALRQALKPELALDPQEVADDIRLAKSITTKLRGLNTRVVELEPKVGAFEGMANEIVQAHAAADQLPTDLVTLREARDEIRSLREMAERDRNAAAEFLDEMKRYEESAKLRIAQSEEYQRTQMAKWNSISDATKESASDIIARCEDAMRTSTSLGLSGAFHDQAVSLKGSMAYWVVGLILALGAGAYFGGQQLHQLSQAIEASTPPMIIWTRLFISLLSVGAPVWFGWLATKQIGQRFRLAEDYAYKASISKAYEGYRREAVELDPAFQIKLFSSALARLDEQPLRFVEHKTHGSPWHELMDSDVIRQALKLAPELAGKFTAMAKEKVEEAKKDNPSTKDKRKAETVSDDLDDSDDKQ